MTETQKARDEQRRACDQSNREGNLRADKQFAETLLPDTAGRAATAFL
jgi:hypothetical protein